MSVFTEKAKRVLGKAVAIIKTYPKHFLSAALIILMILIVYGRDLEILVNEALQNQALSHVLLIPFLGGFLFYLKRDMVKASLALEEYRKTRYLNEIVGVVLCFIAFLVYWYGSHTFYPLEYHLLSIPIFVMGITTVLFSLKTLRVLIFPILFLLFLIPPPMEFMYTVGGTMANLNTQAAYFLLKTLGVPVTLSSSYGSPTINLAAAGRAVPFTIDLPCSGVYTLVAFAMFAAFLAFVASAPLWKKISLFVLGFFVFEVLNVIRITTIVSVGYWFGEEVAMLMFHTVAGLVLIFLGLLLVLVVADKFLKIQILPIQEKQASCTKCGTSLSNFGSFCSNCGRFLDWLHNSISNRFWVKLLLLLLGCSIVTLSIHAPTFVVAQETIQVTSNSGWENATEILPGRDALLARGLDYLPPQFLYRDYSYEKVAHQDASLMYAYFPANASKATVYVDVGVANTISDLHSWEFCLISWQTAQGQYPIVSVLDSKDIQLLEEVPLIARYLAFARPEGSAQATLYWYERVSFNTGITVEQKYVRISLVILMQNSTEYSARMSEFENELVAIGQVVAGYWEPLKSQSLISLGIPALQFLLILSIAFLAFTKTTEYLNNLRRKSNNLKIFNKFASEKEKLVLETVLKLAEEKKAIETRDISLMLEKKKAKHAGVRKFDELFDILTHLEEYRFIRRDIVSVGNTPKLVWKT